MAEAGNLEAFSTTGKGTTLIFLTIDLTSKLVKGFTHSQNHVHLVKKMVEMIQLSELE